MTEKTFYVAKSGVKFEDKAECMSYEDAFDKVEEAVRVIHDYCTKYRKFSDGCTACPYNKFCDKDFYPFNWKIDN